MHGLLQIRSTILVPKTSPQMRQKVCLSVCMCVFTKLHTAAQSGAVMLLILLLIIACHSHWSSNGGINDTSTGSDATKGT